MTLIVRSMLRGILSYYPPSLLGASCGFQTQQSVAGKNRKGGLSKKGETRLVLFHGIYPDIEMFEKLEFLRYCRYFRYLVKTYQDIGRQRCSSANKRIPDWFYLTAAAYILALKRLISLKLSRSPQIH